MSRPAAHNAWSFVLGRVAGVQIEVHVTFVLIFAWLLVGLARKGADREVLVSVLELGLGVAVSLVLHELGHATMAKRLGLVPSDISLTPMGGMTNMAKLPESARVELAVALAGPAVSLLLAGIAWGVATATGGLLPPADFRDPAADLASQLTWLNLVLAGYNLLPIFPMDGGRATRAALAFFMPFERATRVASRIAQVLSVALAIVGLEHPVVLLTAVWIWMNARHESKAVGARHALRALVAKDVTVDGPTVAHDASLEDASRVFGTTFQPEFPVMNGSDVVGVLGFKDLLKGLEKHGAAAQVREAMRREFNGVDDGTPLEDVLAQMKENSDPLVMVTSGERYAGVLPRQNLDELIAIHRALQKNRS